MKKTSIRKDLFLFLKSPDYKQFHDLSTKEKIKVLTKCFILSYTGLFIIALLLNVLKDAKLISATPMKSILFFDSLKVRYAPLRTYYIFSTIFLVPLTEELSFRLFLTKFKINFFIITIAIFLGSSVRFLSPDFFWVPNILFMIPLMFYIYTFIVSAAIGGGLYLLRHKLMEIEEFWNQNTGLIFYTVTILFAVLHISNLKFVSSDLLFMPIILLPFLLYGLSLGYVRVRLGILYSIVLHFIFLSLTFGLPELAAFLKAHPV